MAGTPGKPVLMLVILFALLVAFAAADRLQDSKRAGEWTTGHQTSAERARRTVRGCDDARGELRPEMQHPYSAAEVDGIVKHINMRLTDLKRQKVPYGPEPYRTRPQTGRFHGGRKKQRGKGSKLDAFLGY